MLFVIRHQIEKDGPYVIAFRIAKDIKDIGTVLFTHIKTNGLWWIPFMKVHELRYEYLYTKAGTPIKAPGLVVNRIRALRHQGWIVFDGEFCKHYFKHLSKR